MKKMFVKVTSAVVSLLLCVSFAVSAPLITAKAADNYECQTEAVLPEAKEESLGGFFSSLSSVFDANFLRTLLDINWSVFFSKDYDWKAFFAGDLDTINSKELEALLGTFGSVIGGMNLDSIQSEALKKFLENEYFTVTLNQIVDKLESILKGEYKEYAALFKGDYSVIVKILDDIDAKGIIDKILENKSEKLNEVLKGNYELLKELIDGGYSYLIGLLKGDYSFIDTILNGSNDDIKRLFEMLDHEKLQELIGEKGSEVLIFVERYYDQIIALCNGDYTFIEEIKDGEYDSMFELIENLSRLVGFEYEEIFGNVADKLAALDNKTILGLVKQFVTLLYNALPEQYQKVMAPIVDKIDEIINAAGQIIDYIIKRYGDLNDDDLVSMKDVTMVQANIANVEKLNGYQTEAADVNHDKVVSMMDVVLMQRYIAHLVESLD